jgi:Tetratricopeptide repeat.
MTAPEDEEHVYSAGQGLDPSYEEFTLDPPELRVDPTKVDPVDARVLTDILDDRNINSDQVDVETLLDVGVSYMQIQRFEEAGETFERAARFAEDGSRAQQEAWVNNGVAHAELEEWDAAIGAYQEALRLDDRSDLAAAAETNLAYALWEGGHQADALDHAERAVELDPRLPQAWYNRGFLANARGLHEEALRALANAERLGERTPELFEERALALEALGRDTAAEEAQQQADTLRSEQESALLDEA